MRPPRCLWDFYRWADAVGLFLTPSHYGRSGRGDWPGSLVWPGVLAAPVVSRPVPRSLLRALAVTYGSNLLYKADVAVEVVCRILPHEDARVKTQNEGDAC